MSQKVQRAAELFSRGYNCSQSVLGAFCEDFGVELTTALKLAGGFGSGVRSSEICGAITGAVLVLGLKYGSDDPTSKAVCNTKTEEFIKLFRAKNKFITCRDILGCDVTTPQGREQAVSGGYFKTTCVDMVKSAAEILERFV